jgi:3-hydroxyacyl-CoA dehydrogenase, NAD binding domain
VLGSILTQPPETTICTCNHRTLVVSLEAQALRYVFFAERELPKLPSNLSPSSSSTATAGTKSNSGRITSNNSSSSSSSSAPVVTSGAAAVLGEVAMSNVISVGVVGSGVMGLGIAASFLMSGYEVILL